VTPDVASASRGLEVHLGELSGEELLELAETVIPLLDEVLRRASAAHPEPGGTGAR
jgi:hypothetical protein